MFRKTDPQTSLLEAGWLLPPKKRQRLEKSWAHAFRTRVMPHIDEEPFRDAFHADNGRPNFSIRLLTGAHLLKETNDLTDAQVIEQVEYNLQWQYALGITPDEAHLVQRTMHSYRVKLMGNDRARTMFEDLTRKLAVAEGVALERQRLDSTHVMSNIAVLTRLGLFCETVTHLLRTLQRELPGVLDGLDARFRRRYLEREGYFADAKKEQARRRLPVVAADVHELVHALQDDKQARELEAYRLLRRLWEEQCEVVSDADDDGGAGDASARGDRDNGEPKVQVREPKTVSSSSLQSPHDPDATYGRKGKGYEVQISESCGENNPVQLVTAVAVNGAHESDQAALVPMLEQLAGSGMAPKELIADTGYGSGANIVAAADRGVDLLAPVQDPNAPTPTDAFLVAGEPAAEDGTAIAPQARAQADAATHPIDDEWVRSQLPDGIDLASFAFTATFRRLLACPNDHAPTSQQATDTMVTATFSSEHCGACPLSCLCPTRELKDGGRQLRRAPATIATEARQYEQRTTAFKDAYKIRSGSEATNSTLKGRHGLGKPRVRGRPRVEVAVLFKTLALNTWRVVQHHVELARSAGDPCPA